MLAIAHRGAHGDAPENTLAAFRRAIDLGMDGVELDVHLAATGEVVVIHDGTVNRTTGGKGAVAEMGWDRLKALRVGETERIPRLEEALEATGQGHYCFIEIKHPAAALPAARIVQGAIAKGWDEDKLWLISFQHAALGEALAAMPRLRIGASFETLGEHSLENAAALGAKCTLPHHRACTPERIAQAHRLGMQVIPWTVNSPCAMRRLRTAEADGIISDYPMRLNKVINEK